MIKASSPIPEKNLLRIISKAISGLTGSDLFLNGGNIESD